MRVMFASLAGTATLVVAPQARAQDAGDTPVYAIGTDLMYSTDADQTDVVRLGINADWHFKSANDYQGFRLERIAFRPSGQSRTVDHRLYFRMADILRGWSYNAALGTDGDTVLERRDPQ